MSRNRGIFSIKNPAAVAGGSTADASPLWTFQGVYGTLGLAFHPGSHMVYSALKLFLGSSPSCGNAGMSWMRVDVGWATDTSRAADKKHPQLLEYVNNCDLNNGGNTDYTGLAWMAIAGADITAKLPAASAPVVRAVDRRATVTGNGLVNSPLQGVVFHVSEVKLKCESRRVYGGGGSFSFLLPSSAPSHSLTRTVLPTHPPHPSQTNFTYGPTKASRSTSTSSGATTLAAARGPM